MKINRNNYEVWFLDYYEGQLSPEKVKELMAFLGLHYDLKEEFDSFENISLPPAKKVVFESKDLLKKSNIFSVGTINEKNYSDFFIAYNEGDLAEAEKNNVLQFVEKNPSLKKDFKLFSKTKVVPDTAIIYQEKQQLRKNIITPVGSINEMNYAEVFIAAMEGDLTLQLHTELKEFLSINPHLHKDYNLFGQTKLAIDTAIVFNRKQQIKKAAISKKAPKVRYMYYAVSAAASVIFLITIYFLMNRNGVQKVNTADRGNIELQNNKAPNNPDQVINFTSPDYYANNVTPKYNKNEITPVYKSIVDKSEYIYASALNKELFDQKSDYDAGQPEKITVYGDYYAMMLKKRNESLQQNEKKDDGFLSLKDFALFRTKKALAPDDKKNKVTPSDKLSGWDLADAGVNQINKLAGTDVKLAHEPDKKGFSFSIGDNFEIAYNGR
ncbi:MAG: hypothetical protein V1904_01790 [Bacteroidota bacterium]